MRSVRTGEEARERAVSLPRQSSKKHQCGMKGWSGPEILQSLVWYLKRLERDVKAFCSPTRLSILLTVNRRDRRKRYFRG